MRKIAPRIDLTGQRFGRLVAIEYVAIGNRGRWLWRCDCGNDVLAFTPNVKKGNTNSCGCIRKEKSAERMTKHGLYFSSRAYRVWVSMTKRCRAKTGTEYRDYASKGVRVCDEWASDAAAFVAYVGEPPEPGMSIDRIDNSKGYEPGNVRWATKLEQANNKTNNRWVEYRGERMTLSQMIRRRAADENVPEKAMRYRVERALYGRRSNA